MVLSIPTLLPVLIDIFGAVVVDNNKTKEKHKANLRLFDII